MKGLILAGGSGSRLLPFTKIVNKHLLPVGNYPMICFPIDCLKKAGINDILIISGRTHIGQVADFLGNGNQNGLKFTYKVQENADGIAGAICLAEDFVGNERTIVILGDNIFTTNLRYFIDKYQQQSSGAKVFLKEVAEPFRYGIAELKGDKVVAIEEKPENPKSKLCVTGIYMYDSRVFNIIRQLKPSKRGELEITDVNNAYIADGNLTFDILSDWWIDAGTLESLEIANKFAKNIKLSLET